MRAGALAALLLGLATVVPAQAEERGPPLPAPRPEIVAPASAPRLRVVTQPVYVTTPLYPERYYSDPRRAFEDEYLVCTSIYGNAICKCRSKCVSARSDCRCAD